MAAFIKAEAGMKHSVIYTGWLLKDKCIWLPGTGSNRRPND